MVYPKGCRLLYQAMPDTILKHLDHLFYLPIGFTVANSDVVVDDAQPLVEPCAKLPANLALLSVWT